MSFSFVATMMLIGSSAVIAFVLLPSEEELQAPANAPVSHHRCQREPLQSIRKSLLSELNLQSEPQLPAGGLDLVRKHWRRTFNNMARNAEDPAGNSNPQIPHFLHKPEPSIHNTLTFDLILAVLVVDDFTASAEGGNSTGLKCCPLASEVFMTDLGWDSWVIHPPSLTILTCALCDPQGNVVQCPSSQASTLDANLQPNCCQLTSMKMVPIVYVDQFATLTMASVQLPSDCKCGRSDMGPSSME